MCALVNLGGNDGIRSQGSLFSSLNDSSLILSLAPNVDLYCPPRKRARVTAPFLVAGRGQQVVVFKKQPRSIDTLPDECLYEVLRRLPGDKERSVSACVSKRWLMLLSTMRASEISAQEKPSVVASDAEPLKKHLPDLNEGDTAADAEMMGPEVEGDDYLTRRLDGKKATDTRLAAIAVGTCSRGGLGKLVIKGSNTTCGVTDLGLAAIARGCPSLQALSMWKVPSVTDLGLSEIASGCSLLEKLDLCQCPLISDKGLMAVANKCQNLTTLAIDSCVNISNEGLHAIGRCCPKLKYVTIKDCPQVGDQGLAGLVSSASSLERMKLYNLNISDTSLAVIGYYGKNISELVLAGLQNVTEKGFWVMGNTLGLQKLKSISVTSCNGITDLGLQAVAKGSPDLKVLCIRKSCYLSDAGLKAFTHVASSLENLQLEECNRVTFMGILNALLNCNLKFKSLSIVKCLGIKDIAFCPVQLPLRTSLRSLTVRDCPDFTSSSLAALGKICPQLQNIDLSGQSSVTDASLLPLIKGSEAGFVKVSLSGCVKLTDALITELVNGHGSTLQMLHLEGCKRVTDKSLLAIADCCSVLDDLDLSKCMISDYGVALLASARQLNLRILSLAGCSSLSGKSVPLLGNMGRSLLGLNLQRSNPIITHSVGLLEEMWWCDILA